MGDAFSVYIIPSVVEKPKWASLCTVVSYSSVVVLCCSHNDTSLVNIIEELAFCVNEAALMSVGQHGVPIAEINNLYNSVTELYNFAVRIVTLPIVFVILGDEFTRATFYIPQNYKMA